MRLYVTGKTNVPDFVLDYVEFATPDGRTIDMNWDESEYGVEDGEFDARFKGVCFGEEYANGRIDELEGATLAYIGWYSDDNSKAPDDAYFEPAKLEIEDNGKTWQLPGLPIRLMLRDQDYTG